MQIILQSLAFHGVFNHLFLRHKVKIKIINYAFQSALEPLFVKPQVFIRKKNRLTEIEKQK